MIRRTAFVMACALAALAIPAHADDSGVIHVSAPHDLLPFVQTLVARYESTATSTIAVSELPSNYAAAALKAGTVDIAFSDSAIAVDGLDDIPMAGVPFAVVVNPAAGVSALSGANLHAIFDRTARSWSAVGGASLPIVTIERPRLSAVQKLVDHAFALDPKRPASDALEEGSSSILADVRTTPGAIGIVALPFSGDVSGVTVVPIDGAKPDASAIAAKHYPLFAYEHAVTVGAPTLAISRLIAYIRSRSGDWRSAGFIPMRDLTL
jgi:ABC-type phosphate transport system substrate-binding protein